MTTKLWCTLLLFITCNAMKAVNSVSVVFSVLCDVEKIKEVAWVGCIGRLTGCRVYVADSVWLIISEQLVESKQFICFVFYLIYIKLLSSHADANWA
jgi:hypothetical protein